MQVIASDKLESNERREYACERILADSGTTKELTSSQEINKINYSMTERFIQEHTLIDDELALKEACNVIVHLCQDNNGTGSQSAIYRYIDSLCNSYTGKYTIYQNKKGNNCIRRRTEN